MPLIIDKIRLNKFYINRNYIEVPTEYIAYVNDEGKIKNLRGDFYTKAKAKDAGIEKEMTEVDEDYYYDIVIVDLMLTCDNDIVNPKKFVFLIDNTLYDIFGNEIIPKEIEDVEIDEDKDKETLKVETEAPTEVTIECDISVDFDSTINVKNGDISFYVDGNENFNNGFVFDGSTYLKSNKNTLFDEWTLRLDFTAESVNEYQSLLCFSTDGSNVFNVLTENEDIFIYANNDIHEISKGIENIILIINSNGDVFVNGNLKTNLNKIDLSKCNLSFILGGDYNDDGSVNNLFNGTLKYFGACDRVLTQDELSKLKS